MQFAVDGDVVLSVFLLRIRIISIATAKELADVYLLGIISLSDFAVNSLGLGRDTNESVPCIVDIVLRRLGQFGRLCGVGAADGA